MKICVSGLGLIGGSLCLSLKRAGYTVYGCNRSREAADYALKRGIIDGVASSVEDFDVVFVALPPQATVNYILTTRFKDGAVVADICGVKRLIEDAVSKADLNVRYVGTHPMAGKEVSGVSNACADLFDNASMVLTRNKNTDPQAYDLIKKLVRDMGFKRLVECSAEVHDKKIAYTSQLAHVVSNCYVKDKTVESCLGFTGGSFQDMTRIAGVDEGVWSELYLANADNLVRNISLLIDNLSEVKEAVADGDRSKLEEVLRHGREQFENGKNNSFQGDDIKTTLFKP